MSVKTVSTILALTFVSMGVAHAADDQAAEEQRVLVRENFETADVDDDGALTPEEFEVFMRANAEDEIGSTSRIVRFNAFGRAFRTLDKDEDGLVTLQEFRNAAREQSGQDISPPLTDGEASADPVEAETVTSEAQDEAPAGALEPEPEESPSGEDTVADGAPAASTSDGTGEPVSPEPAPVESTNEPALVAETQQSRTTETEDTAATARPVAAETAAAPSPDQATVVQENFGQADADGNGSLTRQEFEVFMRANAQDGIESAQQVVQLNAYGRAFAQLDSNGDGQIALTEFAAANSSSASAAATPPPAATPPTAAPSVPAPSTTAPSATTPSLDPRAAQALRNFQAADVDSSGGLDLEEFRIFLRAQAASDADVSRRMLRRGPSRRAFLRIDRNNDGFVTLDEFQASQRD